VSPAGTVVAPASVEEAAELLAAASRDGRRVSIGREGGDVVLSTERLDRVLEHEAGDLTATVEAGVRLSALAARLAPRGQMLALDPPGDPTVGACVAAALSGPRRHRYGAVRDLVLGVTAVLADGSVASAGGTVVKNVAGNDLGKLFCGSAGRFGLVARVSLRLHPLPEAQATVAAALPSPADAQRLWQLVLRSQLVPSAADVLWRGGPDGSCDVTQARELGAPGAIALLFEGSPRAVESQAAAAGELLGGSEADDRLWDAVRVRQAELHGRLSFAPSGLGDLLRTLPEGIVRPGIGSAFVPAELGDQGSASARELAERVRVALDPAGVLA
jgi:glycolate oxidase FAD binding subunit